MYITTRRIMVVVCGLRHMAQGYMFWGSGAITSPYTISFIHLKVLSPKLNSIWLKQTEQRADKEGVNHYVVYVCFIGVALTTSQNPVESIEIKKQGLLCFNMHLIFYTFECQSVEKMKKYDSQKYACFMQFYAVCMFMQGEVTAKVKAMKFYSAVLHVFSFFLCCKERPTPLEI